MNFLTPEFVTDYKAILERTENINAVEYRKTRNFIDGTITYLSPYLSTGVISLPLLKEKILSKYNVEQSYKLVAELAWREYFQRVWEARPELVSQDAKHQATQIFDDIPLKITESETGIEAIDKGIRHLYEKGYMHNHLRMYIAMLTCNIAQTKWQLPSAWLYYHLLDGDIASNNLNWQWIAGTFSSKKYFANQENINRYCQTNQSGTYLDSSYGKLVHSNVPASLNERQPLQLHTVLPEQGPVELDLNKPLLIYNSYSLDPAWQDNVKANRVLLLEPAHFRNYPVSEKVISFILSLSKIFPGYSYL